MDEHVLVAGRWTDEPVTFGRVEPLDGALLHGRPPQSLALTMTRRALPHAVPQAGSWEGPKTKCAANDDLRSGPPKPIARTGNGKNAALRRQRRGEKPCAA